MTNFWETTCFPACFVVFPPDTEFRRAAFYLAAEEYLAQFLPEDDYVFTWCLHPTVVIGRNQVAHQEINLDFCKENNIDVIRRKSGGGAIYADEGNIMVSLVTRSGKVEPLFIQYATAEVKGLRALGAPVSLSGRNDIILEGKGKICGNAFYHLTNRNIVHGTMLYDTNMYYMLGALNPDIKKLESKGVQSRRRRVGFLKDSLSISVSELRKELRKMLTNRSVELTEKDIHIIEKLEQNYYSPDFLYGSPSKADIERSSHIEGCGTIEIKLHLKGSQIDKTELSGDFFELESATPAFNNALKGINFTYESVKEALERNNPEKCIRNLRKEDFLETLFST